MEAFADEADDRADQLPAQELEQFELAARDHLSNRPDSWSVTKVSNRNWAIVDANGGRRISGYATSRSAQEDLDGGAVLRMWNEHTAWLTGTTTDSRFRTLDPDEQEVVQRVLAEFPPASPHGGPDAGTPTTEPASTIAVDADSSVLDSPPKTAVAGAQPAEPEVAAEDAVVGAEEAGTEERRAGAEAETVDMAASGMSPVAGDAVLSPAPKEIPAGRVGPVGHPLRFAPAEPVLPPSGAKSRARANMTAIEALTRLRDEDRYATAEEHMVLAQWSGWGAVPDIFDTGKPEWAAEREELRGMLTQQAWGQARRNTLNAHYTDPQIAQAMWAALTDAGFRSGRVLEPGCGSGTFLAHVPEGAQMVGVELDSTTAEIASALHPYAQIHNMGFEDTRLDVLPREVVNAC